MSAPVPKFIAQQYAGGAHGFRSAKRRQLRLLKKALSDLESGCYYFPCSNNPVDAIREQIEILTKALSVKTWGR